MFKPNQQILLIYTNHESNCISIVDTVDRWYHPLSNDGRTIKTEYTDAFVRVKMWRRNDMPPDFDSGFQYQLNSETAVSTGTMNRKYRWFTVVISVLGRIQNVS